MKKNKNIIWNLFFVFILIAFITFFCNDIHLINDSLKEAISNSNEHELKINKFIDILILFSLFIALFWNLFLIFNFIFNIYKPEGGWDDVNHNENNNR